MIRRIHKQLVVFFLLAFILSIQLYGEEKCTANNQQKHYVFVHGAWHGAWCWSNLASLLEASGHTVTVLDSPAHGIDTCVPATVTLQDYVQKVVNVLDAAPKPVILVGHSMGGAVISAAAEARPQKIEKLVYIAAYMLTNGQSLLEVARQDTASHVNPALIINPVEGYIDIDRTNLKDLFYHLSPDYVDTLARTLLRPEPITPAVTPLVLTEANYGSVPRYYIMTTEDHAISPAAQERMVAAQPCNKVYKIKSDHSPFFSKPKTLYLIFDNIVKDKKRPKSSLHF